MRISLDINDTTLHYTKHHITLHHAVYQVKAKSVQSLLLSHYNHFDMDEDILLHMSFFSDYAYW